VNKKYTVRVQNQFKRDLKTCFKRRYNMLLLKEVMVKLENGIPLDPVANRPHPLGGTNPVIMECHIKADWLLEYCYFDNELIFVRTGTHSDLF
jgi:mRNA interferase YafQ